MAGQAGPCQGRQLGRDTSRSLQYNLLNKQEQEKQLVPRAGSGPKRPLQQQTDFVVPISERVKRQRQAKTEAQPTLGPPGCRGSRSCKPAARHPADSAEAPQAVPCAKVQPVASSPPATPVSPCKLPAVHIMCSGLTIGVASGALHVESTPGAKACI